MILSCSTNTFGRWPLRKALRAIADAGYRGVEVLADVPHLYPPGRGTESVRREARRLGLAIVNVNANTARGAYGRLFGRARWIWDEPLFGPSLSHPSREVRTWRVRYTLACVETAARLECPSVCFTSGAPVPGGPPEAAWGRLRESLAPILKRAGRLGVRVGVEYEPGLLVESFREAARLIREAGSTVLGVNLDVGHAVVGGEDPAALIRRHPRSLTHLHVEDIRGRKHYHRIPGEGTMNFQTIGRALRAVGYQGGVSVELYTHAADPVPAARRAHRALAKVFG